MIRLLRKGGEIRGLGVIDAPLGGELLRLPDEVVCVHASVLRCVL
jgi:hypothetical protein